MKHKRVVTVVGLLAAIALAIVVSLRVWGQHEIVVTVESVQQIICTDSVRERACGEGIIRVRIAGGDEKEYRYTENISIETVNEQGETIFPAKGEKAKLTMSHGKVVRIRAAE